MQTFCFSPFRHAQARSTQGRHAHKPLFDVQGWWCHDEKFRTPTVVTITQVVSKDGVQSQEAITIWFKVSWIHLLTCTQAVHNGKGQAINRRTAELQRRLEGGNCLGGFYDTPRLRPP